MRDLDKSKRVSWASVNLCQVRLFLSDESPAQVGLDNQDHLEAKSSWVSQPTGTGFDDNLPPGFEASHPINLLKNKISQIPIPKWTCPPRFVLDITWQVVAGEESKEVEKQNQREMRILEAVYPRSSAIPPNPGALTDLEPSPLNEVNIPLVPITPIEDEDTEFVDTTTYITPENTISAISQPAHCSTDLNVVASSDSQVNIIDPISLIKILNDPKWHERLLANVPNPSPPNVHPPEPPHVQTSRTEFGAPSSMSTSLNGPFYHPPPAKDLSYYKSLIQQHGVENSVGASYINDGKNSNQELGNDLSKKTKACVFFNSSRGCQNGANCPYQHTSSAVHSAKRVKLDRENNGE